MLKKIILLLMFLIITGTVSKAQEVPDTVWTKFMWPFEVGSVLFSHDDSKLYVNSSGNQHFMVLDAMTGDSLEVVSSLGGVKCISPDGQFLYTSSLFKLDADTYQIVDSSLKTDLLNEYPYAQISHITLSSDGKLLYLVGGYYIKQPWPNAFGLMAVADAETMEMIQVKTIAKNWQSRYTEVAISPDGNYGAAVLGKSIMTSTGDILSSWIELVLFDAQTLEQIKVIADVDQGDNGGDIDIRGIAFSPDSKMMACFINRSIRIFDTENFNLIESLDCVLNDTGSILKFTKDSNYLVWGPGGDYGNATVIAKLNPCQIIHLYKYPFFAHSGLDFTSDENNIVAGSRLYLNLLNAKWEPSGVEENLYDKTNLSVFPNPSYNILTLGYTMPYADMAEIEITDESGNILDNIQQYSSAGENKLSIPISHFASGLYFITLRFANRQTSEKLIIMK